MQKVRENFKLKNIKKTSSDFKKIIKVGIFGLALSTMVACANSKDAQTDKNAKVINGAAFNYPLQGLTKDLKDQIDDKEKTKMELNNLLNDKEVQKIIKSILSEPIEENDDKDYINCFLNKENDDNERLIDLYFALGGDEFNEDEYKLNNLFCYDNLDGNQKYLPKQICIFNKAKENNEYSFYKMITDNSYERTCLVTNKDNEMVLIGTKDGHTYRIKEGHLAPFKQLLDLFDLDSLVKDNYPNFYPDYDFFNNILYKLNDQICTGGLAGDDYYCSKELAMLDLTSDCQQKEGDVKNYYFLHIKAPYLFSENSLVYEDVFNKNARVIVNSEKEVSYYDLINYTYIHDEDITPKEPDENKTCFKSYEEFITQYNLPCQEFYTAEQLENIKNILKLDTLNK